MHVMRRLRSIASGRFSALGLGGDSGTKRVKVEEDNDQKVPVDQAAGSKLMNIMDHIRLIFQTEHAGVYGLQKEMSDMQIRDKKAAKPDDQVLELVFVNGEGTETGQVVSITTGGQGGGAKQVVSYMAEQVVGTGSFGVVFKAKCLETGETLAIKKVLQDKRYRNRELQLMQLLDHPNIVRLQHYFFSSSDKNEQYLNLMLEFHYNKMHQRIPLFIVQLYIYQLCCALTYLHGFIGVCHREIKPQNLLVNPQTHQLKLCDFGSAKVLPNISYICSRYYLAPELIFGATEYTAAIDMWSPIFPGESGVDQLVEIIKVLGTPTREEIKCMNPNYAELKFPHIKAHPWHKLFREKVPPEALDLVSRMLQYSPNLRCTPLEACAHPFFDDLKDSKAQLPNGNLFLLCSTSHLEHGLPHRRVRREPRPVSSSAAAESFPNRPRRSTMQA
ncbi:unnamed protein product [Spirodela intermedia]|uniref:non-specific serine/threonine protein kinase n=1 Tax=Spirodela intermedia TaxID=51605 RepID=A0A7I8IEU5_SPIIN|nr:unnamed protein product [Spirodela intermedia]CAA6656328.1 unnamed protein product [Spirodela intermedia]